jgi:uroporphyrinogen-III synthase
MYIVCSPKMHMEEMIQLLNEIRVASYPMPLLDFKFDNEKLKYLEDNINSFDYVMISSPAVIEFIKSVIARAMFTKFITVGQQSANKIKKYTNKEVIYPELSSGQDALFNEKLKYLGLGDKKVLIIKGEIENNLGYNKLLKSYPSWQVLDIYKKIYLSPEPLEVKRILEDNTLRGIIITTSGVVGQLFAVARGVGCDKILQKMLFIAIHPKIEKKLLGYGVGRVLGTKSANKNDIVKLIRGLHD